jgi:D-tyrosyl-tRNA(Tyr) deacylase
MRVVIQRVSKAHILINQDREHSISEGMVVLLAVKNGDSETDLDWLVNKCLGLRIFEDDEGKMNQSLLDITGQMLIVSQFTLYGSVKKGFRPSFNRSASPEIAIPIYESFVKKCRTLIGEENVKTGEFGADMKVSLTNDGPVTIIIDTDNKEL